MSTTTIVKAPNIPLGSDINVTAPDTVAIPAGYYDGTQNVIATGNASVIGGIYPGYQLTRNIWFNNSTTNAYSNLAAIEGMYDNGGTIIFMYQFRNDSSDDWMTIAPLIFNKSTFLLTWGQSQNISGSTSSGDPLGNVDRSFSDDGSNLIKVIFGNAHPLDGEVTYNISTNTRSGYSYTRLSGNKVPLANTTPPNDIFTLGGIDYLMTIFFVNQSQCNIFDPYLRIES